MGKYYVFGNREKQGEIMALLQHQIPTTLKENSSRLFIVHLYGCVLIWKSYS